MSWGAYIAGGLVALTYIVMDVNKKTANAIPQIEQVQKGYIAPSLLEIECTDLDGDGEKQTILRVGDKPYLLKEVDGKPVLLPFEIKTVEVVPK